MYTRPSVRAAIRGVGGRWGSRLSRFRHGVTLLPPLHHVLAVLLIRSTAVLLPITAIDTAESRCAAR